MRESIRRRTLIVLFLFVLCSGHFTWMAAGRYLNTENHENRTSAALPRFSLDTLEDYPAAFESYYNDHLPFRDALIHFNSRLSYGLLKTSPSPYVIRGKDGWLFYNSPVDGDPLTCYKGIDLFTEEELIRAADNLLRTKEALAAKGIEFVLFIAPNKERIYAEKMPDYLKEPAGMYRAKQLVDFLREHTDVEVVYPYEELMEAKAAHPELLLYYRLDTHWNDPGGYIGSRALAGKLGIEMPPLSEVTIRATDPTICDLANLIHLGRDLNTDPDYVISDYGQGSLITDKHELTEEFIYHNRDAKLGKLFMVRDSFADAMDDFVAAQFQQSYMVHYNYYLPEQVDMQEPDVFVYETVERRLGDLLEFRYD